MQRITALLRKEFLHPLLQSDGLTERPKVNKDFKVGDFIGCKLGDFIGCKVGDFVVYFK